MTIVRRAHLALRSRIAKGKTADDVWAIGEVRQLDPRSECPEHVWGSEYVFPDGVILAGCRRCTAVIRVPPAPDLAVIEALERWLSS